MSVCARGALDPMVTALVVEAKLIFILYFPRLLSTEGTDLTDNFSFCLFAASRA